MQCSAFGLDARPPPRLQFSTARRIVLLPHQPATPTRRSDRCLLAAAATTVMKLAVARSSRSVWRQSVPPELGGVAYQRVSALAH